MPRYFFNIDDHGRQVVDKIGNYHATSDRALHEVVLILEWLAACRGRGTEPGNISVIVRSGKGEAIVEVIAYFTEY